jgi:hypothetical protein
MKIHTSKLRDTRQQEGTHVASISSLIPEKRVEICLVKRGFAAQKQRTARGKVKKPPAKNNRFWSLKTHVRGRITAIPMVNL